MKNILLITKREYLTQVKKKSFIVLTLLTPLLLIGFGMLIAFMFKANKSSSVFDVVDNSGIVAPALTSDATIKYVIAQKAENASLEKNLKTRKDVDGILIIPELKNNDYALLEKNTVLLINKKIGFDTRQKITSEIVDAIKHQKIKNLGISEDEIKNLDKSFELNTQNVVDKNGTDSDLSFGVKSTLSMVLMYVIFMFVVIYGVRVMRSVLEEKNNRVVEIIISSVKPFELMMGKIFGVTLVALTQFFIWITMSVLSAIFLNTGFAAMQSKIPAGQEAMLDKLNIQEMMTEISHTLLQLNFPLIIITFIIFFLLGYIFYSSIYAAIGSSVDNETETQQFTLFAIIPLSIGLYGSFSIMNNPDGPMAFWLSIIPFTSPVAMVARIPFGVPVWQLVLSIGLLLGFTLLMVYIAAKIYRVGILMYGNKATLKEMLRWIRQA